MLTYHRLPICLSVVSTDLPIWFTVETAATLYQKDQERFHLLLREPDLQGWQPEQPTIGDTHHTQTKNHRLLWLELSPYRVIMTMQGHENLSYRHLWERGIYGISRYWLHSTSIKGHESFQLQNYTRILQLDGRPLPQRLELVYELWSKNLQLGHYILTLEIDH